MQLNTVDPVCVHHVASLILRTVAILSILINQILYLEDYLSISKNVEYNYFCTAQLMHWLRLL